MLDLKEEQCSVSGDQSSPSSTTASPGGGGGSGGSSSSTSGSSSCCNNIGSSDVIKRCSDCQTTTTPLWRGGPAGPKTLCNACGIKFHKKRRALLGIEKGKAEKAKKKSSNNNNKSNITNSINGNHLVSGMPLKIKVMSSGINRQRENLEVEQAAMLLMALSYGSVYA